MTTNKSQGESLQHLGLDLRTPVFALGQLYVAFPKKTSSNGIKGLIYENANKKLKT
jgi:ATP-dependent DNA helicase PIF1